MSERGKGLLALVCVEKAIEMECERLAKKAAIMADRPLSECELDEDRFQRARAAQHIEAATSLCNEAPAMETAGPSADRSGYDPHRKHKQLVLDIFDAQASDAERDAQRASRAHRHAVEYAARKRL